MAPIELERHSCHHCQRIVFDLQANQLEETPKGLSFDFLVSDITIAADDGCVLSTWLLDSECIHLSKIKEHFIGNSSADESPNPFISDALMWLDSRHGPPEPGNTLRATEEYRDGSINSYVLFASTRQKGSQFNVENVQFFGLVDPETRTIMYRIRDRLVVYTTSGTRSPNCCTCFVVCRTLSVSPLDSC
jgi:hypothetical protein